MIVSIGVMFTKFCDQRYRGWGWGASASESGNSKYKALSTKIVNISTAGGENFLDSNCWVAGFINKKLILSVQIDIFLPAAHRFLFPNSYVS